MRKFSFKNYPMQNRKLTEISHYAMRNELCEDLFDSYKNIEIFMSGNF